MTEFQLRTYRAKPGELHNWVEAWKTTLVPLRSEHGFSVVGAWVAEDENEFTWLVSADGFSEREAAYAQARDAAGFDPSRWLESVVAIRMVTPASDSQ
jgi:pyruvoyl-dependent arginine decarboxylase (PvlArgDC)